MLSCAAATFSWPVSSEGVSDPWVHCCWVATPPQVQHCADRFDQPPARFICPHHSTTARAHLGAGGVGTRLSDQTFNFGQQLSAAVSLKQRATSHRLPAYPAQRRGLLIPHQLNIGGLQARSVRSFQSIVRKSTGSICCSTAASGSGRGYIWLETKPLSLHTEG